MADKKPKYQTRYHLALPSLSAALLGSDFKITLVMALAWQILMIIICSLLVPQQPDILAHTMHWDAGWYMTVINGHYATSAASPAFYPLFPLVASVLSAATFHLLPYSVIGLIVNTASLWLGLAALVTIARTFLPAKQRFLPIVFLLAAPAAFFMHLFYSEALFMAIGFWAYAFALQRRWLWMGIALAFLTATRLPSVLFVLLCGLEYLRAYDWQVKKALNKNVAYFLLAPIGFIAYGLYLLNVRGNFWAMFSAYSATHDWPYQALNPNFLRTLGRETIRLFTPMFDHVGYTSGLLINHTIPFLCILLLLGCSLYMLIVRRGAGIPLGLFGLVSIAFFTLNNNVVSVHRYTLPCLVIYIALAHIYANHQKWRIPVATLAVVMLGIQALLLYKLYHYGVFVG